MKTMNSPTSALPAQDHHFSRDSSHSSSHSHAYPQQSTICTCRAPPNKAYLEPIIGCANKCRPRWFHLRCVGLRHFPYNNAPWHCPTCQVERGIQYESHRVCICDVAPYHFGPMAECAKREDCATRLFHLPCAGDAYVEGEEWYCPDCAIDPFVEQEQEQEQEVCHGHADEQRNNVVIDFTGDSAISDPDDEFEQEQWASDGLPGTFLGEESDLRRQSPQPDFRAAIYGALDVDIAETEFPAELLVPESEVIEHVNLASQAPRAHSGSAQLEVSSDATLPADTPPVSRRASPQDSRQATPQASRRHTPQASPAPGILAPAEEDPSAALPDVGEETSIILSGAEEEEHFLNVLPSIEDGPAALPATHSDAPSQEADPEDEEASTKHAASEADVDQDGEQDEEQEQHLCRPVCTVNDNTGPMVACDGNCTGQWYHYGCVGLTVKPKSTREWYCPECRVERRNAKKRGATQQAQPSNAGPGMLARRARPTKAARKIPALQPSQSSSPPPSRSRRGTRQTTEPEYCTCGTPGDDEMIACDAHCAKEWFHFACVGLTTETVPEGEWYCDECQIEREQERRKKSNNARREKKKAVRRRAQI